MRTLIVLSGLPGAGKTTIANGIVNGTPKFVVVSPDGIREMLVCEYGNYDFTNKSMESIVFDTCKNLIQDLIAAGNDVVVDATNLTKKARLAWLELFGEKDREHMFIHLVCVDTPVDECIANRLVEDKGVVAIEWDELITSMSIMHTEPDTDELKAFDEVSYVDVNAMNLEEVVESLF